MATPSIPRIEQAEMPPVLAEYLAPRVKRLGYLGEMFKVSANTPDVLMSFLHFTDALKDALPNDIAEVAILSVATLMENHYERNQHERLCMRTGFSKAWLVEVEALAPEASKLMSPEQKSTQSFVTALVQSRGHHSQNALNNLRQHLSAAQVMSLTFLVGRYITHALVVNTLGLAPPVPSVHHDGFTV